MSGSKSLPLAAAVVTLSLIVLGAADASAQFLPKSPELSRRSAAAADNDRPQSNSAVEIAVRGDSVWVGGGKGLDLTTDAGVSWTHFGAKDPFKNEDVAALDGVGPVWWLSLAGSYDAGEGTRLPKGEGLARSTDNGATWTRIAQPMEGASDSTIIVQYGANRIKALAVTTDINNITYDIAVTRSAVWLASFAGGLRRSTDGGATFAPVVLPPDTRDAISIDDTLDFELSPVDRPDKWNLDGTRKGMRGSLNHRVFSVLAIDDSTVLVGTAAGINLTTNNGASWRRFSYSNQVRPISGNFVVALGRNVIGTREYIWASTVNALEPQEFRAISYTTDRGATWSITLRGQFTHNFGFQGEIVYAVTNEGVFRSDDAGQTWTHCQTFVDTRTRTRAASSTCYAVAAQGTRVWVANSDGLMYSEDSPASFFCNDWHIFRAAQGVASTAEAYAYPNPFSPDDEVCRIHYRAGASGSVSVTVHDFAMQPVRTIVRNAARTAGVEHDEIWDGTTDDGKRAANGVYYINVETDGASAWTKVIVLQ